MLPSVPNPGTADTDPFLTPDQYRKLTGDTNTDNESIITAVAEAADDFCTRTRRTLRYATYTETMYLYAQGMVYPSATPIDPAKEVVSGTVIYNPATDANSSSVIQASGIWVGWFTPLPWMPVWTGVIPPQTIVQYTGGYQPYQVEDGPTEGLPRKMASCIARLAFYALTPASLPGGNIGGVTSRSVAGVSLAGQLSSMVSDDPQLKLDIARLRKPMVKAWQN